MQLKWKLRLFFLSGAQSLNKRGSGREKGLETSIPFPGEGGCRSFYSGSEGNKGCNQTPRSLNATSLSCSPWNFSSLDQNRQNKHPWTCGIGMRRHCRKCLPRTS